MFIRLRVVFDQGLSIGPLVPLLDAGPMFAEQFENVTEPKLASGEIVEPKEGASTIHSAEDRCAALIFKVMVKGCSVELLLSLMLNVNWFDPA